MRNEIRGVIYGLSGAFFYTVMATIVKLAQDVPTEALVFFRNLIPLFLTLLPLFKKRISIKTHYWKLHFIRAVFGLSTIYCYFIAIRYIPIVDGIVLANTIPLFIPLIILIWFRLAVPVRRVLAVCVGFLGVLVVLQPGFGVFHPIALFGLAAGVFGATALVSVRQLSKTEDTERILFYFFMISTVLSFFPMIFSWTDIEGSMWLYVIGLSLITMLFQFCITRAYTYLPATKASAMMYFSVILGGIFGWAIWGIIPGLWTLIGSVLITLGGLTAIFDPAEPRFISRKKKTS